MAWTRARSSRHESLGGVAERCDGVGDGGANIADEQDQSRLVGDNYPGRRIDSSDLLLVLTCCLT